MEVGTVLTRHSVANVRHPPGICRSAQRRCVLVAGVDPAIRQLLRTVLDIGGFEVVEAASLPELIAQLLGSPLPNVLVLDLQLPAFHGGDALSYVRREPHVRPVPVVVLTSFADPLEHTRLRQQGATAVVSKPFSAQQLLDTIRRLARPD